MRYIFVSDIHGEYDKLQTALRKVNFNRNTDTLVSLGDPFDRGNQNLEVLQFLMGLPHRILVAGNHDLRLKYILLGRDIINRYDKQNGLLTTLYNFCNNAPIYGVGVLLMAFKTSDAYHKTYELLWQYFDECVYCLEWKDLIAVHGWIPTDCVFEDSETHSHTRIGNPKPVFKNDWRNSDRSEWYEATWANTEVMMAYKLFPEKRMIVGHWHAWRLHCKAAGDVAYEHENTVPFTTFSNEHIIAIDGCTAFPAGIVNTFIYESDEEPVFY